MRACRWNSLPQKYRGLQEKLGFSKRGKRKAQRVPPMRCMHGSILTYQTIPGKKKIQEIGTLVREIWRIKRDRTAAPQHPHHIVLHSRALLQVALANDELLDLLKLVHAEDAPGILAMLACLLAEARGQASIPARSP